MLKSIFFWLTKGQRVQELAIQAESMAHSLNSESPDPARASQQDIIEILESTCALLAHFTEQQKAIRPAQPPAESETPTEPPSSKVEPLMPEQPQPSPAHEKPELSLTANELIKLSDWVLLAKADGTAVQPKVLEEIYRQLTAILAKENVTLLQAKGPCDYERQMVIGTQPTDDPSLNDCVYSTVRPGYLFHQQLIRPQEVIIYTR